VRNLSCQDDDKGLSAGEKRMLTKAKQILLSEISVAIKKDEEKTEELIDRILRESQG
jgi:CarD family transcriptional regulator